MRWLEFFGNKQYTSEPGEVIDQADDVLNVRNWTKEEQRMYDEVTRQQDHYWASYMYAQEEGRAAGHAEGMAAGYSEGMAAGHAEGMAVGHAEGMAAGLAEGIEQGRMKELIDLVKEGLLTKEIVAKKLKLSEEELEAYL